MSAAEQRVNRLGMAKMVVSTVHQVGGTLCRVPSTELVPTLDGTRLGAALGEDRGSGGFMLDFFDTLGETHEEAVEEDAGGWAGAARLSSQAKELPGLPPGFAVLFMCPCGDPHDGSVGVKITVAPSTVTWSEPTEVRPDWSAQDPLETWELVPRPSECWRFDRDDYDAWVASYVRAVNIRDEEFVDPFDAPDGNVRWDDGLGLTERSWLTIRNALTFSETSLSWSTELWDQLSAALVAEDPLNLWEVGDVLDKSYEGAVRDLSNRIPARRFLADPLHWMAPYFEQVWDRPADRDALRRVAARLGSGPAGN
ncbi:hypothetical protein [Galactobacter caseinivorans]|uniref:Uncharacterized protein n=1 Tax=Galactobacter caseinivorans TaxID=2676123 RepID=A0A496PJX6_9MICC|nr:hypothetical protein [Galactobacter caseinivorans]RKW70792.1 hypothetical protein DWQ67_06770 [Galactobacter caseinivorans]